MFVSDGRTRIMQLISAKSADAAYKLALGTGSTAAADGDSALEAQVLEQNCSITINGSTSIVCSTVFQSDGASYQEIGLFTEDDVLLFRKIIASTSYTTGELFIVNFTVTVS